MTENEAASAVVDICYHLHRTYGPGLLETVYEELICYELTKRGVPFERQWAFKVIHEGMRIGFRADIVVYRCLIVELKSVEHLPEVYFKQIDTYLRVSGLKLGLLINSKSR